MAKLIIWVPGKPNIYGFKRREFIWSEKHKCFVFRNAEFSEKDFNDVVQKAMFLHPDLHPSVKVIEFSDAAAPVVAPVVVPDPASTDPLPPPVADAPKREVTVEEAEAVLLALAPELLKKKAGRKPAPVLEVT